MTDNESCPAGTADIQSFVLNTLEEVRPTERRAELSSVMHHVFASQQSLLDLRNKPPMVSAEHVWDRENTLLPFLTGFEGVVSGLIDAIALVQEDTILPEHVSAAGRMVVEAAEVAHHYHALVAFAGQARGNNHFGDDDDSDTEDEGNEEIRDHEALVNVFRKALREANLAFCALRGAMATPSKGNRAFSPLLTVMFSDAARNMMNMWSHKVFSLRRPSEDTQRIDRRIVALEHCLMTYVPDVPRMLPPEAQRASEAPPPPSVNLPPPEPVSPPPPLSDSWVNDDTTDDSSSSSSLDISEPELVSAPSTMLPTQAIESAMDASPTIHEAPREKIVPQEPELSFAEPAAPTTTAAPTASTETELSALPDVPVEEGVSADDEGTSPTDSNESFDAFMQQVLNPDVVDILKKHGGGDIVAKEAERGSKAIEAEASSMAMSASAEANMKKRTVQTMQLPGSKALASDDVMVEGSSMKVLRSKPTGAFDKLTGRPIEEDTWEDLGERVVNGKDRSRTEQRGREWGAVSNDAPFNSMDQLMHTIQRLGKDNRYRMGDGLTGRTQSITFTKEDDMHAVEMHRQQLLMSKTYNAILNSLKETIDLAAKDKSKSPEERKRISDHAIEQVKAARKMMMDSMSKRQALQRRITLANKMTPEYDYYQNMFGRLFGAKPRDIDVTFDSDPVASGPDVQEAQDMERIIEKEQGVEFKQAGPALTVVTSEDAAKLEAQRGVTKEMREEGVSKLADMTGVLAEIQRLNSMLRSGSGSGQKSGGGGQVGEVNYVHVKPEDVQSAERLERNRTNESMMLGEHQNLGLSEDPVYWDESQNRRSEQQRRRVVRDVANVDAKGARPDETPTEAIFGKINAKVSPDELAADERGNVSVPPPSEAASVKNKYLDIGASNVFFRCVDANTQRKVPVPHDRWWAAIYLAYVAERLGVQWIKHPGVVVPCAHLVGGSGASFMQNIL